MSADYPSRVNLALFGSQNAAGNLVVSANSSALDCCWVYTPNTDYPTGFVEWLVLLRAGTWTITTIHRKADNLAIATVTLGGVTIGTIDGYGAASNVAHQIAGVVVGASGLLPLRYATKTKNPAAVDNFGPILSHVTLQRTGA